MDPHYNVHIYHSQNTPIQLQVSSEHNCTMTIHVHKTDSPPVNVGHTSGRKPRPKPKSPPVSMGHASAESHRGQQSPNRVSNNTLLTFSREVETVLELPLLG